MCNFFSFCTDETGKKYYFDWNKRVKMGNYEADSHSHICHVFGIDEDKVNKYEYNPLTGVLKVDEINTDVDDRVQAEKWVRGLDWKTIVKQPLIVKSIVNPLTKERKPTKKHIALLREWASVRASVRDSVWDSVRASVWDSVWALVGDSVWDSVGDSVGASVRASVRASVWASVGASVVDSVGAYVSTFFDIDYKYDFSSAIKLWEAGFVPSFDGKTWRLHSGKDAKIVYEWTKAES